MAFLRKTDRIAALVDAIDHGHAGGPVGHHLHDCALDDVARIGLVLVDQLEVGIGNLDLLEDRPHIHRHRDGFLPEVELVVLVIPLGKDVGVLHQPARIVREPEIDARLEQDGGECRDQQRRHRRNHREEKHQAHVQSRGAPCRPA